MVNLPPILTIFKMLDVKIKYPQASQVIKLFFKGWGEIKRFIYFGTYEYSICMYYDLF